MSNSLPELPGAPSAPLTKRSRNKIQRQDPPQPKPQVEAVEINQSEEVGGLVDVVHKVKDHELAEALNVMTKLHSRNLNILSSHSKELNRLTLEMLEGQF